jgi:hypothetical protein
MTESNGHQPEKIDILVDQVGRLTESVYELRLGISELKDIARQQTESIKQMAQQQNETVSRLVEIVNRQTETVDALIRNQQNG